MTDSLTENDEALVTDLIAYLQSQKPLGEPERRRRFHAFFRRVFDAAEGLDITLGEAGLWRGTAVRTSDQDEFRRYLKSIQNDLPTHVRLIREGVEALNETGSRAPPGSVRRLAIILRRAKRLDLEQQLLRSWLAICTGNSQAYEDLITRLFRVEELLKKQERS
jgi:hypothetical protein